MRKVYRLSKSIQIRVEKEYIDQAVKTYINKRIAEICKKQGVDDQIALEVSEAIIEVRIKEGEHLLRLENRVNEIEQKFRIGKFK